MPNDLYRIVTDKYLGFEVQSRRWWSPFWNQVDGCNTHWSIEIAEEFLRQYLTRRKPGKFVKFINL